MEVFTDRARLRQREEERSESDEDASDRLLHEEEEEEEAEEVTRQEEQEDVLVVDFERRRPVVCVLSFLVYLSLFTAATWTVEDVDQKRTMREALKASLFKAPFQIPRYSAEEWESQANAFPVPSQYTVDAWTSKNNLLEPGGVVSWNDVEDWLAHVVGYITSTGVVANLLVLEKLSLSFKQGGLRQNTAAHTRDVVARVWDRKAYVKKSYNLQELSNSSTAFGYSILQSLNVLRKEKVFSPLTTQLQVQLLLRDNSDNAAHAAITFREGATARFEVAYDFFFTISSSFLPSLLLLLLSLAISIAYLVFEVRVYFIAKRKMLLEYVAAGRHGRARRESSREAEDEEGTERASKTEGVPIVDILRYYFQQRYLCFFTSVVAVAVSLLVLLRLLLAKALVSAPSPSFFIIRILDAMEETARVLSVALTLLFLLRLLSLLAAASTSFFLLRKVLSAAVQEFSGVHSVVAVTLIGIAAANHVVLGVDSSCFASFWQSLFYTVSMIFGSPLLRILPPAAAAFNIFFITSWWCIFFPMIVVLLLSAVKRTLERSRLLAARLPLGAEIPAQVQSCMTEYIFCCTPSVSSLNAYNELRRMHRAQPFGLASRGAAGGEREEEEFVGGKASAAAGVGKRAADGGMTYEGLAAAARVAARNAAAVTGGESREKRAAAARRRKEEEEASSSSLLTTPRLQLFLLLLTAALFAASICLLVDSPRLSREAAAAGSEDLLHQPFLSTDPLSTTDTLQAVPPLWRSPKPNGCNIPSPAILLPLPLEPLLRLVTLRDVTSLQGIYDWIEKVLAQKILSATYATPYLSPHAPLANPGALLELRRVQLVCRDTASQSLQALSPVRRSGSFTSSASSSYTSDAFGNGALPPFAAAAGEQLYRTGLFFTPNPQLREANAPAADVAAQQRTLSSLLGSGAIVKNLLLTQTQFLALYNGYDSLYAQAVQLKRKGFIDYQMRLLDVSWVSYNGDSDVYLLNTIRFQLTNSGGLQVTPYRTQRILHLPQRSQ